MLTKTDGAKLPRFCLYISLGILIFSLSACTSPPATPLPPTATLPPPTLPATEMLPAALPPPTPTEIQLPTPETQSNGCPVDNAGATAYTNNPDGYCLLIPSDFTVNQPAEGLLVITGPNLDDTIEPVRAMLTIARIGSSGGRALEEIAQDLWSGARQPYTQTALSLGGDPAIAAEDLLIGEADWKIKEVVVIHAGMTYKLTFTPVDESGDFAKALPDIQKLWDTVFASLVFLF